MSTPCSALVAVTVAAAACAHAPASCDWTADAVKDGDATVVIRYGEADREVANQIRRAVRLALPIAERWGPLRAEVVAISVQPTHEALELAARRPGCPWLRAWARADSIQLQSPRTWSRGFATDEELVQLLAHELTHCVMYQAIGGDPHLARGIPVWFREGMATSNAGERFPGPTPVTARLPFAPGALLHDAHVVYETADHAFRFLLRRFGAQSVQRILATVGAGLDFPDAFREITGVALTTFEQEFGQLETDLGSSVALSASRG